jgi:hypothetical protein
MVRSEWPISRSFSDSQRWWTGALPGAFRDFRRAAAQAPRVGPELLGETRALVGQLPEERRHRRVADLLGCKPQRVLVVTTHSDQMVQYPALVVIDHVAPPASSSRANRQGEPDVE